MKKYLLILLGFMIGFIFASIVSIYAIKVENVKSNGQNINNVGITISVFGSSFDYYCE